MRIAFVAVLSGMLACCAAVLDFVDYRVVLIHLLQRSFDYALLDELAAELQVILLSLLSVLLDRFVRDMLADSSMFVRLVKLIAQSDVEVVD